MLAVYKRELNSYFVGPMGWMVMALLCVVLGIFVRVNCFVGAYPHFEHVLSSTLYLILTILAVCLLTMRCISEERRQKTDQLLYSLPLGTGKIILGKYLAMLTVLALTCLIFCAYPLVLGRFGTVNMASAYTGLLGYFFLCAALIAIGLFASCLTENPVVAAVIALALMVANFLMSSLASYLPATGFASLCALWAVCVVLALVLYLMTRSVPLSIGMGAVCALAVGLVFFYDATLFEGLMQQLLSKLSLFDRFYTMIGGTLDLTSLLFDLSIIVLFLFFGVQSMEKRRWS